MPEKKYAVNEVFYSVQGEGIRAGTPNVFIRFQGCNLRCSKEAGEKSPGGFDCDTEFQSGRLTTLDELSEWVKTSIQIARGHEGFNGQLPGWIILTGGEPGLQVDEQLCEYFHAQGYKLAIETNGTVDICGTLGHGCQEGIDWITCSPKVAEHAIKCNYADEVKYVRGYGQGIPVTRIKADHYLISPAFDGEQIHPKTLAWCNRLVLENPQWRLSLQLHKFMKVR